MLCVGLTLAGVWGRGVWTSDEPRVAAIALEMADRSNFVVPYLSGEPFVEKPPFYYGAGAVLVRVLGPWTGEIAALRLAGLLFAWATLFFTYRLGLRLGGKATASLALIVLATMGGFVHESTWIRVDVALLACVSGAAWAFAEAYLGGRLRFLSLAGVFVGLSLLAKGFIGPALIFPAWLGAFVPWLLAQRAREDPRWSRLVALHVGAFVAAAVVSGSWMIWFHALAGPDLWRQWFVDNQLGRFAGSADLGHVHAEARPLFYARALVSYTLPWSPLVFAWGAARIRDRRLSPAHWLLLSWFLGAALLLSLGASKRGVYALPLLPACALMCADVAAHDLPRWARGWCRALAALSVLALLAVLVAPLLNMVFGLRPPGRLSAWLLLDIAPVHIVACVGLWAATCLALEAPRRIHAVARAGGALVAVYLAWAAISMPALDRFRNVSRSASRFGHVAATNSLHPAAFNLSENTRGYLYVYGRQAFPRIRDCEQANRILRGGDPDFDAVIIGRAATLRRCVQAPYAIRARAYLGDRSRPRDGGDYVHLVTAPSRSDLIP